MPFDKSFISVTFYVIVELFSVFIWCRSTEAVGEECIVASGVFFSYKDTSDINHCGFRSDFMEARMLRVVLSGHSCAKHVKKKTFVVS